MPEWFPGASFKRKARQWKEQGWEMRDSPFEKVKRDMVSLLLQLTVIFKHLMMYIGFWGVSLLILLGTDQWTGRQKRPERLGGLREDCGRGGLCRCVPSLRQYHIILIVINSGIGNGALRDTATEFY